MRYAIALLLLAGCDMFESSRQRQCEYAGGIIMRHRDEMVCVAREGLQILPIRPEHHR